VWKHEAYDFTPWLASNADRLAEALGIEIEITDVEYPVGAFSLDLRGRDLTHDTPLMVENQLERSDHTHLGQLLTYAAGTGALTIVWIATEFRDEHRQALTWMNEQTDEQTHFFAVELEVVKIGDSVPAPLFNVVVLPNDWQKSVKAAASGATSGRALLYAEFWSKFSDRIQEVRPSWKNKAKQATQQSWFPFSVGAPSGCIFSASFTATKQLRHELYINRATGEECKALFDSLLAQREAFEAAYGRELQWERLDDKKASRIADYRPGDVATDVEHDAYIEWLIDAGDRLRKAMAAVVVE
jgi:hypothetical protein